MAKPMQIGSLSSKKIKPAIPIIGSLHTNGSTVSQLNILSCLLGIVFFKIKALLW